MDIYVSLAGLLNAAGDGSQSNPLALLEKDSSAEAVLDALEKVQDSPPPVNNAKASILNTVDDLVEAGIDGVHLDVYNGGLFDPCPFDTEYTKDIAGMFISRTGNVEYNIEAHLLVPEPVLAIEDYKRACANRITIPYRSFNGNRDALPGCLKVLRQGRQVTKAGVSFTPAEIQSNGVDLSLMHAADYVVIECAGSKSRTDMMIPIATAAVRRMCDLRRRYGESFDIIAEGGVRGPDDAKKLLYAGADHLVLCASLFRSGSYRAFVRSVRSSSAASLDRERSSPYPPSRSC